jgi:hypothetical protein
LTIFKHTLLAKKFTNIQEVNLNNEYGYKQYPEELSLSLDFELEPGDQLGVRLQGMNGGKGKTGTSTLDFEKFNITYMGE